MTVDDMREDEENLRLRASEAADEIVAAGIEALRTGLLSVSLPTWSRYTVTALLQQPELEKALKMLGKGIEPEEVMAVSHETSLINLHAPTPVCAVSQRGR